MKLSFTLLSVLQMIHDYNIHVRQIQIITNLERQTI